MTDGELVQQAAKGHTAAYGELVQRWSTRVLAMCHARVGRAAVAEELAQETLLRGLRALPSIENPDSFGSWICGIAHRVCLDWRKAKQTGQVSLESVSRHPAAQKLIQTAGDVATQSVEQSDEQTVLLQAVETLPDELREILLLYYYEDATYQQLAELLQVSVSTVNTRLTKARAMLRTRLADSGSPS
jgi:RNA polymerase sigma-70 factor (ECF subfamily)